MTRRQVRFALLALAAIALVAGAYFGYHAISRWQQRDACQQNLRDLAQAIHDYEKTHRHLPPAYVLGKDGKPWHSWRVLILPYLGRRDLYDAYNFDEPWDGPNNSKLIGRMPDVFACPADRGKKPGRTSYVAIVGAQTA